jgi:plastocyanin
MRFPLLACAAACLPALAHAAPVTVVVRGTDGRPLADAVVMLTLPGVPAAQPHGSYAVEQRDISFVPHVLIVPVGATVAFPNRDKVRHHVYSFSPAKRFNLKLYGHDDTRQVTFDKPGPVALGCNIHDQMSGFVFVTTTPFAAVTGGDGTVRLDVPAGRATLSVWHPSIRAPGNLQAQPAQVGSGGFSGVVSVRR